MKKNVTIVTGLWDLKRGDLNGWAKRDFQQYKDKFFEMLEVDVPMCIWIPTELEDEVREKRGEKPTKIFIKNNEDFESWNPFFKDIQKIRNNPQWKNFAGWLSESPQAALEYYNPMMFTKMFMLNDSAIINPFGTEYFFWIDGGLTNTVHKGYFQKDKVFDNLENYCVKHQDKFVYLSYPYESNDEIHGFERTSMAKYCETDYVKYVCRGGFFGGKKDMVHQFNAYYYSIMEATLKEGLMGADECLFTILSHRYKDLVHRFDIGGNGLVWPFFEELKEYTKENLKNDSSFLNPNKTALYVITFNSPNQFKTLLDSILQYDEEFLTKTQKFLLNNSTDSSTFDEYDALCKEFNFEHIKKDNLGICGGRQFIAEHFDELDLDFYLFFEDDMFFHRKDNVCRNGFNRYVPNLYSKSLEIIKKENFDFLKLNFSEFYGDNSIQWSWYNVPQNIRQLFWPDKPKLPQSGLDPNAPRTNFKNILSHKGVPYATGEIYYCNWPQIVSKHGNKKIFLETTWAHPFEQTWMSHIYQLTKEDKIYPGILLMTPTEHNRFEHYERELRKES